MSVEHQEFVTLDQPRISRDEMNLAEFPLTILSTRTNPKIKTLEFSDSVKNKDGDLINRRWIITGADKFGLPTSSDDEVLLGLLKLTVDNGMNSPKVYFTRYEMLKTLKWTTEGRSYSRLQKALDRLSGVRIKATNAFYDNETKTHSTKNFGILDAYEINDGRDNESKKSFFIWSEVIFKSFQVGFIKKLDLDFYLQLQSSISKRIYRYLDKHFWYKSRIQLNLFIFAHEKVGISRNYRFMSSIRQQLDPAIEELIKTGFISSCEYIGRGENAEIVLFSGKKQPRVLTAGSKLRSAQNTKSQITNGDYVKSEKDQDEESQLEELLFKSLLERGIKSQQVEKLLRQKSLAELKRMQKIIAHYDYLVSVSSPHISKNPVGFLYRAVENPYLFNLPGERQEKKNMRPQPSQSSIKLEDAVSAKDTLESLKSKYLVDRKRHIQSLRSSVENELLVKIGKEVRAALVKLQGLISESRFNEAIEHGIDERLAKLFAVPDFEEWVKTRRLKPSLA